MGAFTAPANRTRANLCLDRAAGSKQPTDKIVRIRTSGPGMCSRTGLSEKPAIEPALHSVDELRRLGWCHRHQRQYLSASPAVARNAPVTALTARVTCHRRAGPGSFLLSYRPSWIDRRTRLIVAGPAGKSWLLGLGDARLPQPTVEVFQDDARMIPPVGDQFARHRDRRPVTLVDRCSAAATTDVGRR
jgi:hypothetical protein